MSRRCTARSRVRRLQQREGMHRVSSCFREALHSFCVNFADAVDAPSGGGFSTMTNDELVRGAMFQREQVLLHPTDGIELSARSFFSLSSPMISFYLFSFSSRTLFNRRRFVFFSKTQLSSVRIAFSKYFPKTLSAVMTCGRSRCLRIRCSHTCMHITEYYFYVASIFSFACHHRVC